MVFSAWRWQKGAVTGVEAAGEEGQGGMAGVAHLNFGSLFGISDIGCGRKGGKDRGQRRLGGSVGRLSICLLLRS